VRRHAHFFAWQTTAFAFAMAKSIGKYNKYKDLMRCISRNYDNGMTRDMLLA